MKQKFFEYLLQLQDEWKVLKESNPLDLMPYMESHFLRLTSLETYTGWIKPRSYYHWVVAQNGQLSLCTHLASLDLPRGLMMPPQCLASPPNTREEQEALGSGARSSESRDKSSQMLPSPMEVGGAGDHATWGGPDGCC